jgi:hypothetical protein
MTIERKGVLIFLFVQHYLVVIFTQGTLEILFYSISLLIFLYINIFIISNFYPSL